MGSGPSKDSKKKTKNAIEDEEWKAEMNDSSNENGWWENLKDEHDSPFYEEDAGRMMVPGSTKNDMKANGVGRMEQRLNDNMSLGGSGNTRMLSNGSKSAPVYNGNEDDVNAAIAELEETFRSMDKQPNGVTNSLPINESSRRIKSVENEETGLDPVMNDLKTMGKDRRSSNGRKGNPRTIFDSDPTEEKVSSTVSLSRKFKRVGDHEECGGSAPNAKQPNFGQRLNPSALKRHQHSSRNHKLLKSVPIHENGGNDFKFNESHNSKTRSINSKSMSEIEEWSYKPPIIEGFDVDKFKELNGDNNSESELLDPMKLNQGISVRRTEEKCAGENYLTFPAYTSDELALYETIERETKY